MAASDHDVDWDAVGYAISSKYRVAVIEALADDTARPTEIADDPNLGITHISRAIRRLRDRGVVELLVDEDQSKPRRYGLTEQGDRIAAHVGEVA